MFLKPIHKNILLSALTGLLAAFAFPKMNLFFLAWAAFIPLFFVIFRSGPFVSFIYAFIAGLVFNLQANFWLIDTVMLFSNDGHLISVFFYVLFCEYFAVYWGIWGLFSSLAKKYCPNTWVFIILSACLWTALEYARSYILGKWPWLIIAYSQYKIPQLIQIAEFTGVYGVSFAIMLVNALLYFGIKDKKRNYFFAAAAVLAAVLIFGIFRYGAFQDFGDGKAYKVAAVQSNVEQYKKLDGSYAKEMFAGIGQSAAEIAKMNADIVVWSESEIINPIPSDAESFAEGDKAAKIAGGMNIIGAPHEGKDEKLYNAVFYFDGKDGYAAMHTKNHLVPFGEYMPFGEEYSNIIGIPNINDDIIEGKDTNIFTDGELFVGSLICSENLFPDITRRFVLSGAKVLTNHTNDAWFFDSSALYKHFSANVFRAVESRKTIVASANTGVSGIIDASGKIVKESRICERAIITGTFLQNDHLTFYVLYGDIFMYICFIFIAGFVIKYIKYKK